MSIKLAWIFQSKSMGILSYENDISLIISYPPLPSFQIPPAMDSPHLALLGNVSSPENFGGGEVKTMISYFLVLDMKMT